MTIKLNTSIHVAPQGIYQYINKYYAGAVLLDITFEVDEDYNVFHTVSISLEDTVYHLKFDSEGALVHRKIESLIELLDVEYFDYD